MTVRSRTMRLVAALAAVPVLLLLALAVFPWGIVARRAAGPLATMLDRPVAIGAARRGDWIGFVPTIALGDVRVGQPAWAGPGDMARIDRLTVRLPVLPLLFGHVRPRSIVADGLALRLVRDADGRDTWSGGKPAAGGGGGGPRLGELTIRNGRLRLDDARRHVALDATLVSDGRRGLRIDGAGTLRDLPLRLAIAAPAIARADPAQPYPVVVAVRSPLVAIDARVRMDHPLDLGHFAASLYTSGRDLGNLDDILQAGLFRTRRFDLAAEVRRDGREWHFAKLDGVIGRSVFTSALDVTKPEGRTYLAGRLDARTLDFGDFASGEQQSRGAAGKRPRGPHVIPDTRIVLDKLGKFDGRIDVRAAALLSAGRSPLRALQGTAVLDHRRLTLAPLTVALPAGRMTGRAVVDGRGAISAWRLDLHIAGATARSVFPDQQVVDGPMRGRILIAGSGPTLDAAVAGGRGRIAFVVDRGTVRRDYATFLGGDVLKSVGAALKGTAGRVDLQCLIASFAVGGGRLVPDPLVLGTSVARGDGTGAIALPAETIDLRIVGRPMRAGLLQSTAPVRLFGTLSRPAIDIRPPRAKSTRGSDLLSRVGFFVKKLHVRGDAEAAPAAPVPCGALAARALR